MMDTLANQIVAIEEVPIVHQVALEVAAMVEAVAVVVVDVVVAINQV